MSIAARRLHTSNLIPFIPRQIMLGAIEEKKEKRTKKRSSETLENGSAAEETLEIGSAAQETLNHVEDKKEKRKKGKRSSETLENGSAAQETLNPPEEKKEKRKKRKGSSETLESDLDLTKGGKGRGILINSILTFLESNGFSRTLAEFRSEAQHEIDSGITSVLNLEDLFGKFLGPRSSVEDLCAQNTGIGGDNLKELKALGDEADLKKLLSVEEAPNGTKDKKKQKLNLDSLGEHAEKCHLEDSKGTKKRKKKDRECGEDVKPQEMTEDKKEESKSLSNSYAPLNESSSKHKDEKEKKKKKKRTSNSLSENAEQKEVEASEELIDKKSKDLKSLDSESQADFDQLNSRTKTTPTQNAFQRVKIDEVKFVDERLQDNSYWAKDGAESGYGAKAQEILGQVRGRNFRHEKTKKKRGSYRGGQIDLLSHSVKFNYSDEE